MLSRKSSVVIYRHSRSRAGHEPVQSVMWTGVLGEGERTSGPIGQNDRRSGSLHRALNRLAPTRVWLQSPTRSETPRLLCGAAAPGAIARTGRASDLDMRCSALPSLSAVVVLSLTFPRQSPRESPSRHLALLCVFRTHRMCAPNGVFKRRTTDRMRARERASSRRSHCVLLTSNCCFNV